MLRSAAVANDALQAQVSALTRDLEVSQATSQAIMQISILSPIQARQVWLGAGCKRERAGSPEGPQTGRGC